jgi:hypothetical protein
MDGEMPPELVKTSDIHLTVCAAATKQLMNQPFEIFATVSPPPQLRAQPF